MKVQTLISVLCLTALALTACGPAPEATQIPQGTGATESAMTPADSATDSVPPAGDTTGTATVGTPAAATTGTPGVPVTGDVIVRVVQHEAFGPILVDAAGFTLYLFTGDTQTSGTGNLISNDNDNDNSNDNGNDNSNTNDNSNANGNDNSNSNTNENANDNTNTGGASACTGDCLEQWTPLSTNGSPVAGEGVDASRLGTITRDDGSLQVTYNGWPLYRFRGDLAPGDLLGQGTDAQWFMVSPDGEPVLQ